MGKERILLIGSGGREYATALKLLKSPDLHELVVAPGSDGIEHVLGRQDPRVRRVPATKQSEWASLARQLREDGGLSFVLVGPEQPLVDGIGDQLEALGIPLFGPNKKAARLEGSKLFAKEVFTTLGIPTANPWTYFDDLKVAKAYVQSVKHQVVVKADGLAAGKGVTVCDDVTDALAAIDECMVEKKFGAAGERVVIERRLYGKEFSFIFVTDGKTVLPLPTARDYKRRDDGDKGPNTGGMGAYSPNEYVDPVLYEKIMNRIVLPLVHGLREVYKIKYRGVLYVGGMAVEENGEVNPRVLELNVRNGDPEAQVNLLRLSADLVEIGKRVRDGNLEGLGTVEESPDHNLCLVLVSEGYPGSYKTGIPIFGLENVGVGNGAYPIHAGTKFNPEANRWETDGGRVLGIVGKGETLKQAKRIAYQEAGKVIFGGKSLRNDVGR